MLRLEVFRCCCGKLLNALALLRDSALFKSILGLSTTTIGGFAVASDYRIFAVTSYEGLPDSFMLLPVPYAVQRVGYGAFLIGSKEVVVLDILAN